ncbi:hypothetical protein KP77_16670 [Jeotgalibacillus alimentarius]|uniref:Glutaredoxin domain-containing protein n=1 Tax=Jeotgalibacillus alimentarius TaxID=135826 RepID=A0A0C2VN04_9BACL|nr:hypothetical protein KP77_16670 [Jeotgalibacillus alimentarius]
MTAQIKEQTGTLANPLTQLLIYAKLLTNEYCLKEVSSVQKVILYTQPQCPPCEIVKRFFKANQVEFSEINIKEDTSSRQYMIDTLESYSTPTVVINDSEVVRGFNLESLAEKLNISCD